MISSSGEADAAVRDLAQWVASQRLDALGMYGGRGSDLNAEIDQVRQWCKDLLSAVGFPDGRQADAGCALCGS